MLPVMGGITVGAEVRKYYEDDAWDVGFVQHIDDVWVVVDFYDWIERWPVNRFSIGYVYLEGIEVFLPEGRGEVIEDFRRQG